MKNENIILGDIFVGGDFKILKKE